MSSRDDELIELLTTHKRQIFGFIFGLVHRIADAEDVFQQTSFVLWEKFDQFEKGSDFVAWACSIARYKAINFLRSRNRSRLCFSESLLKELTERQQARPELFESRAQALEHCKEKLSPKDQEMLEACYARNTTIKKAADQLDRPVESVYDSLSRIRRALAECIEHQLSEGGN